MLILTANKEPGSYLSCGANLVKRENSNVETDIGFGVHPIRILTRCSLINVAQQSFDS